LFFRKNDLRLLASNIAELTEVRMMIMFGLKFSIDGAVYRLL